MTETLLTIAQALGLVSLAVSPLGNPKLTFPLVGSAITLVIIAVIMQLSG